MLFLVVSLQATADKKPLFQPVAFEKEIYYEYHITRIASFIKRQHFNGI